MITDKEAREAAQKIKEYCWQNKNCGNCIFCNNDCSFFSEEIPANWCIETEALSDVERTFAIKEMETKK